MPHGPSVLDEVQRLYDGAGEIEFHALLSRSDSRDDALLAELIEADGRLRLKRGKHVRLERYLQAVPELMQQPDALDAAIDVTLRSLSGAARVSPGAVEALVQQYPQLEQPIREAAALNAALWSTSGLRNQVKPPPAKPLPCDFGPMIASGEPRYRLQKLLGQGAFGQVYLALDRQLSEDGHTAMVAIKILVSDRSPWNRQRQIEEATKVRRISHPNVVLVLDRGVSEADEDYIVYEYVDGGDLGVAMATGTPMPLRRGVELVARIARGVHAAHAAGVIHCDLKPGNIMLTTAGEPKVADFGIAVRLDDPRSGVGPEQSAQNPIGNIAFISPEQYRGEVGALSISSDIYALGGILFFLICGTLPNGSSVDEIAKAHNLDTGRAQPPAPRLANPAVGADLDAICRRAMAIKPEQRYDSAAAFAEDLERWLRLEPIAWTNPSAARVVSLWARRKPALAASYASIGLLLAAAVAAGFYAQQKRHQAAITTVRLQEEQKHEQQQRDTAQKVVQSLKAQRDYKLNTELLPTIWALEYVYGPAVLGWPDLLPELWQRRDATIRQLVELAHERGGAEHFETLNWETALAFWLVSDGDYIEAQPLLARTIAKCEKRLEADDPWLEDLRAMSHCAALNRIKSLADGFNHRDDLHRIETDLLGAVESIAGRRPGTPMHVLVLKKLLELYGPELLNEPDQRARFAQQLQPMIQTRDSRIRERAPQ